MLIRIILAVSDTEQQKRIQSNLMRPDILIQTPRSRKDLWDWIVDEPSDVLIIGQSLLPSPLKEKILELQSNPDPPALIALTDDVDIKQHARLMAAGCDATLSNGLAASQLRDVIETMLEKRRRLTQKLFFSPKPLADPSLADFVSESPGMSDFMNLVPRVVVSDTALLIEGETGVGKERLARAMHIEGPRSGGRFVALNCGAIPEHLLESELFGHVRGAFTGATAARRGWFEIAHRGTLFLDEIGEIPLHLQVKLLRVLQEHEIQPIGGEKSFGVDVRVIAASNRPLESEVEGRRFRRDLYHRISVVTVTVPPLRDRIEDIPDLVKRHIDFIARQLGKRVSKISPDAMDAMRGYSWPGNVRELNNVIERAILLCDDSTIMIEDLPINIAGKLDKRSSDNQANGAGGVFKLPEQWLEKSLDEVRKALLSDLERQYIEGLLNVTNGRIGEAAERAGIQDRSLYNIMKKYDLNKEDFK